MSTQGPGETPLTLAETAAWFDALYSRCTKDDGEIVIVHPTKKKLVAYYPVGDMDSLFKAAKAVDGLVGHYYKVNLMDGDAMRRRSEEGGIGNNLTGNQSEVKTICSIALDVDAGKSKKYPTRSEVFSALCNMPKPPTAIINSDGQNGGFHIYWILKEPVRIQSELHRQEIKGITKRWENRLKNLLAGRLDNTSNIDRMLRLVGQERPNGNFVYSNEDHYWPERVYSLKDLTLEKPVTALQRYSRPVTVPDDGKAWREMLAVPVSHAEIDGSKRVMRYAAIAKRNCLDEHTAVECIRRLMAQTDMRHRWTDEAIKKRLGDAR